MGFHSWNVAKQRAVVKQFSTSIQRIQASRIIDKCKRLPLGRAGVSNKCKTEVNKAMADVVNAVLLSFSSSAPSNFTDFAQTAHGSARMDGSITECQAPFDDRLDLAAIVRSLHRALQSCIQTSYACFGK